MPRMLEFDHIRKLVEGKRCVRMERMMFDEIVEGHNEIHLEFDNGVTLALTSTGLHVMKVPISQVQKPQIILGK